MRYICFALVFAIASSGCSHHIERQDGVAIPRKCISVDDLRHGVDAGMGREFAVCGVLKYQFEDTNLYANSDAANLGSSKHCVSLITSNEIIMKKLALLNGGEVLVSGIATNEACPKGSLCLSYCSSLGIKIENVMRIKRIKGGVAN